MAHAVQYVTTSDGVRVAYTVYGKPRGLPLIAMRPPQWSHLERERQVERSHHEYDELADERLVVRFDPRGTGMSDRGVEDQSLEARLRDLEAVVGHLGLERVALDAISAAGLVAIAYAARCPEHVGALSLQNAFASGEEWWSAPPRHSLLAMAAVDWASAADAWAWLTFGSTEAERVRRVAAHIMDCMTGPDFLRQAAAERVTDLTDELPRIACPTLVLGHPVFGRMAPQPLVRTLATAVPDARLVTVRNTDERVAAIRGFLAEVDAADAARATAPVGASRPAAPAAAPPASLSHREREVLALLAEGLTNRLIAEQLVVSVRTIDAHLAHIYAKLGARGRAEAVAYAVRNGLA